MYDFVRNNFKENIKKYRLAGKQAGLTYCKTAKAFAEYINIDYNRYIDYERKGNAPPFDVLVKIATALGVSIDKLLNYAPPKNKQEIEIMHFLQLLDIPYKKDNTVFILYYPQSLLKTFYPREHNSLTITYNDICDTVYEFKAMKLSFPHKIQQMLFLEFAKEYANENINDPSDRSERRAQIIQATEKWCADLTKLEVIKKNNDFHKYFAFLHEMFEHAKANGDKLNRKDAAVFYYGFKEFRGGKE